MAVATIGTWNCVILLISYVSIFVNTNIIHLKICLLNQTF